MFMSLESMVTDEFTAWSSAFIGSIPMNFYLRGNFTEEIRKSTQLTRGAMPLVNEKEAPMA